MDPDSNVQPEDLGEYRQRLSVDYERMTGCRWECNTRHPIGEIVACFVERRVAGQWDEDELKLLGRAQSLQRDVLDHLRTRPHGTATQYLVRLARDLLPVFSSSEPIPGSETVFVREEIPSEMIIEARSSIDTKDGDSRIERKNADERRKVVANLIMFFEKRGIEDPIAETGTRAERPLLRGITAALIYAGWFTRKQLAGTTEKGSDRESYKRLRDLVRKDFESDAVRRRRESVRPWPGCPGMTYQEFRFEGADTRPRTGEFELARACACFGRTMNERGPFAGGVDRRTRGVPPCRAVLHAHLMHICMTTARSSQTLTAPDVPFRILAMPESPSAMTLGRRRTSRRRPPCRTTSAMWLRRRSRT